MKATTSDIAAFVLAGGRSSRMGTDKALLPLGGRTLIEHVTHRLARQVDRIAINRSSPIEGLNQYPHVPDTREDQPGPLEGVLAGLRYFKREDTGIRYVLTASCDSPFLPLDLARKMLAHSQGADIVTVSSAGRTHPVFALWSIDLADNLDDWLAITESRRVMHYIGRHRTVTVEFPLIKHREGMLDPFFNINTPADLSIAAGFVETLDD